MTGASLTWDLPTRLFHWFLATSVVFAFFTGGSDRALHLHVFAGYLVAFLILFRLMWGWLGTRFARFDSFRYGWHDVAAYLGALLAGRAPRYRGHNPAGSWAILAMLSLLGAVTATGLAVFGGEEGHGPLAGALTIGQGVALHALHEWMAWGMAGLAVVHVAGVAVESALHRENLVGAMIGGKKRGYARSEGVENRHGVAVSLLVMLLAFGGYYFRGAFVSDPAHPYRPFRGPLLPDDPLWRGECGSCHLAYHPSLLPARSWERLLAEQGDHFGEDLALEESVLARLREFHRSNAAEREQTEAAWKIAHSVPPSEVPLKITETAFWREQHQELGEEAWREPVKGKGDCGACHLDASEGTFEDGAMRLPPRGEATPES